MPDLWTPGMAPATAGPSLQEFVTKVVAAIEGFAARRGWERAFVEVHLHDGTNFALHSISPEPGYGFLTLCPYPEDAERPWPKAGEDGEVPPDELIVPVASIVRITLGCVEEPHRLGFSPPSDGRGSPRGP